MMTNFPSTPGATPANPEKYIQGDKADKVETVKSILMGKPQTEQAKQVSALLQDIYDLQGKASRTPVLSEDGAVLLKGIQDSLSAMAANLTTSLGMKSENDVNRAINEMRARVVYYKSALEGVYA